jgi:hypothetical protein
MNLHWHRLGERDAWEATHGSDVWSIVRHGPRWAVLRNSQILGHRPRTIEDAERKIIEILTAEESAVLARRRAVS